MKLSFRLILCDYAIDYLTVILLFYFIFRKKILILILLKNLEENRMTPDTLQLNSGTFTINNISFGLSSLRPNKNAKH